MSDQSSCSMHVTDQSSKSDLTNSAVLVMLELNDEVAIGAYARDRSKFKVAFDQQGCMS